MDWRRSAISIRSYCLTSPNETADCECPSPGYCNRHRMNKLGHLHKLCQTQKRYREAWDKAAADGRIVDGTKPRTPYEQAADFLSSSATFLYNGAQVTPKELHEQRLSICRTCEELKPGKVLGVALPRLDSCNVCGCFVTLKAAYPHEKCPVGLWDSVSTGKGCGGCGG